MLTMHSQIDNDPAFSTTAHGWTSAAEAVAHWKTLASFSPYLNGRQTVNGDGFVQRVWFTEA